MAFPPDCGARFAHFLTSVDGSRSIHKPCGAICSGTDREKAVERLEQIRSLIYSTYNQVIAAENELAANGDASYPVTTEYDQAFTDWDLRYQAIPNVVIDVINFEVKVLDVWLLVQDATCLLDVFDAAATAYGKAGALDPFVPEPPPKPETLPDALQSGVKLLFAAAGIALITSVVLGRSKRERTQS